MNAKLISLVALSLLIIGLIAAIFPRIGNSAKPSDWDHLPLVRIRNISIIRNALYKYQGAHNGHLPGELFEIVPDYISLSNAACFFPFRFNIDGQNALTLANFPVTFSNYGAYNYLGERGFQQGIILYERKNLWPQAIGATGSSNDVKNLVETVSSDYEIQGLPVIKLMERLTNMTTR